MRRAIHNFEILTLTTALVFIAVAASNATPLQVGDQDNDTTRAEIANFDRFLDTHPAIAAELRKNPALVNDSSYVDGHAALKAYFNDHPQVRAELQENPTVFMKGEQRFDRNEAGQQRKTFGSDVATVDRFLDYHPDIAQQLAKDPSLVNNPDYLRNHPVLQQYLQSHPNITQDLRAHPDAFMAAEQRYDASGRDISQGEVSTWDDFLHTHQDIAQELARDPSLADNADYIKSHPAFQKLLSENPGIHGELIENPQEFMTDAANYRTQGNGESAHVNYRYPGAVTEFDSFLDSHPAIAEELYRDPSLAENPQYLANHPELQQYLQAHPAINQQLAANPRGFMDSERRYDEQTSGGPRPFPRTVGVFDQFLDSHPGIAQQLAKDPSLATNQHYLANHPELQQYLQSHPEISKELAARPDAFMSAEERYDRSGDQARLNGMGGAGTARGDHDTTFEQLKSFGGFLSDHPDLAEQLRAHPAMINSEAYISDHPELQTYLKSNPGVAEELKENPQAFMSQLRQNSASDGTAEKSTSAQKPKLTPNPSH